MAQKFRIATASSLSNFNVIGVKSNVSEDFFWQTLKNKVKELTAGQPENFEQAIEMIKPKLKNSIVVLDTWFEIKGRP